MRPPDHPRDSLRTVLHMSCSPVCHLAKRPEGIDEIVEQRGRGDRAPLQNDRLHLRKKEGKQDKCAITQHERHQRNEVVLHPPNALFSRQCAIAESPVVIEQKI